MTSSQTDLMRELHDEHAAALWGYCVRLTNGDRPRAQDIVQETLLQSWIVADAMSRLSPDHRLVLVECYYRGRSVAETAQRLDIPEGTVKSRTHYALRALRLALEEMGVGA